MGIRVRATGIAALGVVLALLLTMSRLYGSEMAPAPDPALQEHIRRAADAFAGVNNEVGAEPALREIAALDRLARADPEGLVAQLVLFATTAEDSRHAMVLPLLIHRLQLQKTAIVSGVLPFLDDADERSKSEATWLLHYVEDGAGEGLPDFSYYRAVLEVDRDDPPEALVEYMYRTNPGLALLSLLRVYVDDGERRKPMLWAEHVVGNAIWRQQHVFLDDGEADPAAVEQLGLMSRRGEWWSRLYVAAVLAREAEFRSPDLVNGLSADPHRLVRRAAAWEELLPAQRPVAL